MPAPIAAKRLLRGLHWLNATAILEPSVAVVWQNWLGRSVHAATEPRRELLLFLGLWLVYMADRLLDANQLPALARPSTEPRNELSYRHEFCLRFKGWLWCLWSLALFSGVSLGVLTLRPEEWVRCARLTLLAMGYVALVHLPRRRQRLEIGGLKEVTVAALYTQVTTLFVPISSALIAPCLGLFGLALLNLLNIAEREREQDAHYPTLRSVAHTATQTQQRLWRVASGALLLSGVLSQRRGELFTRHSAALLLSVVALLVLRRFQERLTPDTSHALMDLALLGPLISAIG